MAKKPVSFMRPHEVENAKEEATRIEASLSDPRADVRDRPIAQRRLNDLRRDLDERVPPDTTPEQRTILSKQVKELAEAIRVGMPSKEEMRRKPDGAINKHRHWEQRNKARIRAYKNAMLTLNKGTDDPEVASIERLRPTLSHLGMHSAAIGKDASAFSFASPQFQANYDEIDWSAHRTLEALGAPPEPAEPPRDRAAELLDDVLSVDTLKEFRDSLAAEAAEAALPGAEHLDDEPEPEAAAPLPSAPAAPDDDESRGLAALASGA